MKRAKPDAQGRLDHGPPVAVIDIGSNSVRLVVYEGLTRSPTELFNEKALCGLGREVQSTGLLAADAVEHALSTLKRYRALCERMGVRETLAIATAACRDAKNGRAFIRSAERTLKTEIDILSGAREAELTALGVISGVHRADGIVGDLGGGSLELVDVRGTRARQRTDPPARRAGARRHIVEVAEKGGKIRQENARRAGDAQGLREPHLLCRRRHLALGGAAAHVADRLSAARDARLRHCRRRSARVRQIGASGRCRNAVEHRSGEQCAAAAVALRGARARIHPARRQAAAGGVLRTRRARGTALFDAQAQRAGEGRADRGGAPSQPVALALAAPRRGADRVDRPFHGVLRAR